jgi:transposase
LDLIYLFIDNNNFNYFFQNRDILCINMANSLSMELAMMGYESDTQSKLFYTHINIEKRIPTNHVLRRFKEIINFNFIYTEVKEKYGYNGNESIPPSVILKMMLLLVLYNVRSERELMNTIPLRIDWLWFLGYDIDSQIPDHSVLSKARKRWGVEAFRAFFERIVWQCVEAGLVDGNKVFIDSSLVDANASNNSVVDTHKLKRYLNKAYRRLEQRLDDLQLSKTTPANSRHISTTDPDASVVRHGKGKSKLRYKTHRSVDPQKEVVTATKITPGAVNEGHLLEKMIQLHEQNTQESADTVVADTLYGKSKNYLLCYDRGTKAHIPPLEKTHKGRGRQQGIFPEEAFTYEPESDTFRCPAGQTLKRRSYYKRRKTHEYKAPASTCARCELKDQCTSAKNGRTLKRRLRQNELDTMLRGATTQQAKTDIKYRQHLSERSFAQAERYGFKQARWRGLWRVEIQDFLIATIQNILILIKHTEHKTKSQINALHRQYYATDSSQGLLSCSLLAHNIKEKAQSLIRNLMPLTAPSHIGRYSYITA